MSLLENSAGSVYVWTNGRCSDSQVAAYRVVHACTTTPHISHHYPISREASHPFPCYYPAKQDDTLCSRPHLHGYSLLPAKCARSRRPFTWRDGTALSDISISGPENDLLLFQHLPLPGRVRRGWWPKLKREFQKLMSPARTRVE